MSEMLKFIRKASDFTAHYGKICTIAGDAGIGKTTVAYLCFPKPLFIPIERGLLSVPNADAVQEPQSTGEVLYFLEEIKKAKEAGDFPYDTIILDSISELETMAVREVQQAHGVTSLGDIKGFGTGYSQVTDIHRSVREASDELVKLGLNVVAISHTTTVETDFPDEESYSRYSLQVGRGGMKQWLNQVDCVMHVKSATSLKEVGNKKHKIAMAIKNQRLLDMVAKPSTMAKNRFGVNQPLTFQYDPETGVYNNPIAPVFGFAVQPENVQAQPVVGATNGDSNNE